MRTPELFQPYVVDVDHLVGPTFQDYREVVEGTRTWWAVEDREDHAWRRDDECNRVLGEVLFSTNDKVMQAGVAMEFGEVKRTFGDHIPDPVKATVLLRHLKSMRISVGQQIQFVRRGKPEFTALITKIDHFERPGERLGSGDIRNGFLLHFSNGEKT